MLRRSTVRVQESSIFHRTSLLPTDTCGQLFLNVHCWYFCVYPALTSVQPVCVWSKNSLLRRVCAQRVCYLAEGQTVFVLVFVFDLKVVQCFALRRGLAQRTQQLDVTRRQETMATVELTVVPVVVHLAAQDDDVTLGEVEIAGFFSLVGVEGLTARQRWDVLKKQR